MSYDRKKKQKTAAQRELDAEGARMFGKHVSKEKGRILLGMTLLACAAPMILGAHGRGFHGLHGTLQIELHAHLLHLGDLRRPHLRIGIVDMRRIRVLVAHILIREVDECACNREDLFNLN